MNEYIKKDYESLTSYWIRLYKNRQAYGLTFKECGDLMNEVSGSQWNEAKWRREMEGYLKVTDYLKQENPTGLSSGELQEIEDEKLELQKEKIKFRDQKREFNAKLRKMARLEHLEDYLRETVESFEPLEPIEVVKSKEGNNKELLVLLSDWHLGMEINNKFNKFNKKIARQRINKVKQKALQKVESENIQEIHIANLGDSIHGIIHTSARVQSEEDVVQQIITAAEYFKEFLSDFLLKGINVKFYNVGGNHSRAIANKNDVSGIEENFEKLILTVLDTSYGHLLNYTSYDSQSGMIESEISGNKVIFAHGDYDKGSGIVNKLPQLLGYVPNYVFTGHLHRESIHDYGITTHVTNGSLCGSDDYAIQMRLSGKPSQKILVFENNQLTENNTVYL